MRRIVFYVGLPGLGAATARAAAPQTNIMILLDGSGSMANNVSVN